MAAKVIITTSNGKGDITITERQENEGERMYQEIAVITIGNPRIAGGKSVVLECSPRELRQAVNALWPHGQETFELT